MKTTLGVLGLTVALGWAYSAFAVSTHTGGETCQPTAPADASLIGYGQFGVHNVSSTTVAGVSCTVAQPFALVNHVNVVMYDRHSGADVFCNVQVTGSNGLNNFSGSVNTNSSSPSAITKSIGAGVFGVVHVQCGIPMTQNGNVSHVASISTD